LREVLNGTGMLTTYNTRCWVKYQGPHNPPILDMYELVDGNEVYNLTE
jgi:hypothetical protein